MPNFFAVACEWFPVAVIKCSHEKDTFSPLGTRFPPFSSI